jgi:hypothetical protein
MGWMMPAAIIGSSLFSGARGSGAASSSADAQVAASQAATEEQRRQFDKTQANNAPFLATGTAANARLSQLLGTDPNYQGGDSGSLLRKFSTSDLNADPVYQNGLQFGLDQGTGAINARALQSGGYDSGSTLKALTRYANDYGTSKANDSYNRSNTDNSNIFNKLSGISGTGQTAVNTVASAGANAANQIGQNMIGAGNASAAGIVGGANAWNGALQGAVNGMQTYQNNQVLKDILSGKRGTNTIPSTGDFSEMY